MSDNHEILPPDNAAKHDDAPRKGPSLIAYTVKDRGDQDSVWRPIGAAFMHKDKKGLDLVLDAMPVDGRVTLRAQRKEAFKEKRREAQTQNKTRTRDQEHDR